MILKESSRQKSTENEFMKSKIDINKVKLYG